MADSGFSIYCLKDPLTKEVMYVGSTKHIQRRYKQHTKWEVDSEHNKSKNKWVKTLLSMGLTPELEIIKHGLTLEESLKQEIFYIKYFNKSGHLFNMTLGGKYFMHEQHHSPETKLKIRLASKGKPKDLSHKRSISIAKRGKNPPNKGKTRFDIDEIRKLYSNGVLQHEIAKRYNTDQGTICRIINKINYQ